MSSKASGRWRFTTILTSTRRGTELYTTLDDMPAVLRARCVQALQSDEAASVMIADAAGHACAPALFGDAEALPPPAAPRPWWTRQQLVWCAAGVSGGALALGLYVLIRWL